MAPAQPHEVKNIFQIWERTTKLLDYALKILLRLNPTR
jgi:hypothetical protein